MAENRPVTAASETDDIQREIERTRVELGETLGEIQDRLRPDHLLQQARDGVAEAATGKVRTMMHSAGETANAVASRARDTGGYVTRYAQGHPFYVAIAVGALTYLMLRGRDRSEDWYGAVDTSWDDSEAMSYSDGRSLRDRVGEYASTARETVGEYASTAREMVGEYASTARDAVGGYAETAKTSATRASRRVRTAASTAYSTSGDWVAENPMAAGAIALAVGAAIGMSLPNSDYEDRVMGETRDQAWQRAAEAARNLKENVSQKVQSAAENFVADSVTAAASSPEPMGRA